MAGRWIVPLLLLGVVSAPRVAAQCPDGSSPPCRTTRAAAPSPNSVAVLYFDNLSPDTADAYLADGLTEEVTSRLGEVARLRIKRPSRDAVRRIRSTVPDYVPAVGRVLRVAYLVEGSVRGAGERVRVAVRLLRSADGIQVWAEDYDRTRADLFGLQRDIARAVARGIAGRLGPAELASLAAPQSRSPEAYEHLLRGNFLLGRRNDVTVGRAIQEYEAALRLDPQLTRAVCRIAYGYALFVDYGWRYEGLPAESTLNRGLAVVNRGLRQDSTSSDCWMGLGFLLEQQRPLALARTQAAYARAIAHDPWNAEALHRSAFLAANFDNAPSAEAAYRRALEVEPGRAITLSDLAWVALTNRDFAAAQRWADSALALEPDLPLTYSFRAVARLYLGDTSGAAADAEMGARAGDHQIKDWVLIRVALRRGDTLSARTRFAPYRSDSTVDAWFLAENAAAVGEYDRAFEALEGIRPRDRRLRRFLRGVEFDPIRTQPRFQRLVRETSQ